MGRSMLRPYEKRKRTVRLGRRTVYNCKGRCDCADQAGATVVLGGSGVPMGPPGMDGILGAMMGWRRR